MTRKKSAASPSGLESSALRCCVTASRISGCSSRTISGSCASSDDEEMMRVSFKWLRELLEFPAEMGPREVGDRLTLAGLEVEAVEELGASLKSVVVGQ